jgi:hypothetical protein
MIQLNVRYFRSIHKSIFITHCKYIPLLSSVICTAFVTSLHTQYSCEQQLVFLTKLRVALSFTLSAYTNTELRSGAIIIQFCQH